MLGDTRLITAKDETSLAHCSQEPGRENKFNISDGLIAGLQILPGSFFWADVYGFPASSGPKIASLGSIAQYIDRDVMLASAVFPPFPF